LRGCTIGGFSGRAELRDRVSDRWVVFRKRSVEFHNDWFRHSEVVKKGYTITRHGHHISLLLLPRNKKRRLKIASKFFGIEKFKIFI
jgi:hypothetical protein